MKVIKKQLTVCEYCHPRCFDCQTRYCRCLYFCLTNIWRYYYWSGVKNDCGSYWIFDIGCCYCGYCSKTVAASFDCAAIRWFGFDPCTWIRKISFLDCDCTLRSKGCRSKNGHCLSYGIGLFERSTWPKGSCYSMLPLLSDWEMMGCKLLYLIWKMNF